ncbi:MAG: MotA/TolQ/ExbB proton channel family protein, partial [Gammaproteobacteria bacterium]|nr:MotA/TolQ/ExbB proton channel family protein [Gammaproteobacteria bacterium]
TNRNEPAPVPDARLEHSTLYNLFEAGRRELVSLPPQGYDQACGVLNARGLEVLRTGLDAELVAQTNRLNQRLVLVTIAVSGGPFLGLLGTVVGVMITFATIAAAGDVNVNTIAPGVASALTTTVMGLLVAIPSLFGYNYLAGRIARRISVMEVFIDRLLSRLAMSEVKQVPESARNAA